ncbi:hypothetical protein [Haladaptatus sp. DYF46]|uniref:hypothetical protein n=1 Tax=Haladaptatus sp. DYF46 TaxID=2886041 RepID=UPI001E52999C|nr:hypothetical protein [Haladaptatus sp. DYF46]
MLNQSPKAPARSRSLANISTWHKPRASPRGVGETTTTSASGRPLSVLLRRHNPHSTATATPSPPDSVPHSVAVLIPRTLQREDAAESGRVLSPARATVVLHHPRNRTN